MKQQNSNKSILSAHSAILYTKQLALSMEKYNVFYKVNTDHGVPLPVLTKFFN